MSSERLIFPGFSMDIFTYGKRRGQERGLQFGASNTQCSKRSEVNSGLTSLG